MKHLIFASIFTLLALHSLAQNPIGQSRQFLLPVQLNACKIDGTFIDDDVEQFFSGMKFSILSSTTSKPKEGPGTSGYVIMIGAFNPIKANTSYQIYNSRNGEPVYYFITGDVLTNMTTQLFPKWSPQFGAMTFPFKYRPQSGAFEPSFNLSATGGVKFDPGQQNNVTFLLLGGVGPSSVPVDPSNSNATEPSTAAAVSFSLNFVVQWKTVQLGLSCGMDNLLSPTNLKYNYQGRGWLSLGIGLSIFSVSTSTTTSTTNNDNAETKAAGEISPARKFFRKSNP